MRKIRKSLSAKVFLWVMCALTICSMAIYAIVMLVIPEQYTSLTNNQMTEKINQLTLEIDNTSFASMQEQIYNFCVQNHVYAILTVDNESISFGNLDTIDKSKTSLTLATSVQPSDCQTVGTLTMMVSATTVNEIQNSFVEILPFIVLLMLFISGISAVVCSKVIVSPIIKISNVSKRMANMDMTWNCDVKREDELGILADSLNCLSSKLSAAMEDLEDANEKLRNDLAQMNAMEKQRRDFFIAVSHELKTPITVMKGQIESMIMEIGRYVNVKEVLPETLTEIERMEDLVKQILFVTKIEMNASASQEENISVGEVLENLVNRLESVASEKDITLHYNEEEVTVQGNAMLLQKAFHNIIWNAIQYSPKGAKVFISLSKEKCTVENTNTQLPAEDIASLFTPFYRVEKSRNKSTGGSGLGLYIVKTILDLHGFKYGIKNEEQSVVFTIQFI